MGVDQPLGKRPSFWGGFLSVSPRQPKGQPQKRQSHNRVFRLKIEMAVGGTLRPQGAPHGAPWPTGARNQPLVEFATGCPRLVKAHHFWSPQPLLTSRTAPRLMTPPTEVPGPFESGHKGFKNERGPANGRWLFFLGALPLPAKKTNKQTHKQIHKSINTCIIMYVYIYIYIYINLGVCQITLPGDPPTAGQSRSNRGPTGSNRGATLGIAAVSVSSSAVLSQASAGLPPYNWKKEESDVARMGKGSLVQLVQSPSNRRPIPLRR